MGKPDLTPSRAEKRTASRYYQLKSGHALTGVYLKNTDNRPYDHCWWCDPENDSGTHQTRDHLFKHYHRWTSRPNFGRRSRRQRRGGSRSGAWVTSWRMRGAAQQCFLRSPYVGRAAPPVEENWDSDEEEEQRAVAAAGVMGEEEEPAE